jgi:hypothetical protein
MGDPLRLPNEHVPLPDYIQSSRQWAPGAGMYTTPGGPGGGPNPFGADRDRAPPQTAVDPAAPLGPGETPSQTPRNAVEKSTQGGADAGKIKKDAAEA